MAYTQVADPLLDANKPIRSTDIKQMRDNQDDHESRILALEDPTIRVFSHFAQRYGYTSALGTFDDQIVGVSAEAMIEGNNFYVANTAAGGSITNEIGQSATADDHFLRFEASATGHIMATASFNLARSGGSHTITYIARCRMSDNTRSIYIGLIGWTTVAIDDPAGGSPVPTVPYIILNENTGTNAWRFSCYNGSSTTHGSDLSGLSGGSKISNNTWFEIKITFTDDPSDQALCYVDNVLEETLTTNLPTTQTLYGHVAGDMAAGDTMDTDRMEVSANETLSDAT